MTIDRESRHGEGEDGEQEQPEGGVVYLDWLPQQEEGNDRSQRVGDVLEVEVRDPATTNDYDEGELVLHQANGVAVFDRNHLRGFRAQEGVAVPAYERSDEGDDSADTGAE